MNTISRTNQFQVRVKFIDGEAWLNRGQGWNQTTIFDTMSNAAADGYCAAMRWQFERHVTPCNLVILASNGRYKAGKAGRWHDVKPARPGEGRLVSFSME